MKNNGSNKAVVFFDFDNTITMSDIFDDIVARFSRDDSWKDLERRWKNGEIGSRACLEGQVKGVRVNKAELDRYLATVKLDPYFPRLIKLLHSHDIKTFVLSDNFDYILKKILTKNGFSDIPVHSNSVKLNGERLIPSFPQENVKCPLCGHCKKDSMFNNVLDDAVSFYVGDGLSDLCAAKHADIVFAKGYLKSVLKKENFDYMPIDNLKDVYSYFKKEFDDGSKTKNNNF